MTYYRNVFMIEVLSDEPLAGLEVSDIDRLITDGPCSGLMTVVTANEEVSEQHMAELLIAQGSDPEFLIPAKEDAHDDD